MDPSPPLPPFHRSEGYLRLKQQLAALDRQFNRLQTKQSMLEHRSEVAADETKRLAALKSVKRLDVRLLDLDQQREQLLRDLDQLVAFAKQVIHLAAELPETDEAIHQLIEQGKYHEANALLEAASISQAHEARRNRLLAHIYLFNARLVLSNSLDAHQPSEQAFEQADHHHRAALDLCDDFKVVFAYAQFLYEHHQYQSAANQYELCKGFRLNEEEQAAFHHALSNLYRDRNDFAAAITHLNETLAIRARLSEIQADLLPLLAETYNEVGLLHRAHRDHPKALVAYTQSLELYESLVKNGSEAYLPHIATVQNNLGVVKWEQYDYAAALQLYDEALRIRRPLAKAQPAVHLPALAEALSNLGLLYRHQAEYEKALEKYSESVQLWERLARMNPAAHSPELAAALNQLGNLHRDRNDYAAAEAAFNRSLTIANRLAQPYPQFYKPLLATVLHSLGVFYVLQKKDQRAETHLEQALELRRELADDAPFVYDWQVAETLTHLGKLYDYQHQPNDARYAYEEAVEMLTTLANQQPKTHTLALTAALLHAGEFYLHIVPNRHLSLLHTEKGLQRVKRLLNKNIPRAEAYARRLKAIVNDWKARSEPLG